MLSRKCATIGLSIGMGVRLLVAFLLLCCLSYGVAAANDSCVGQPFGWKYPDRTDCHGYFVCYMDRAYQAYCDYAEKFDDITKKCVPGKCPPCNCDAVPTVEPTPTTTPTPPLTPESTPTVVPTPEPSPDPSTEPPTEPSTEPSTEPTLTPEPTSGPTSEETAAPTPGETPTPEPSPEPSPEPTPEPTPTPTPTPEQTPSVEPSPEPSPNPDPTTGPTPTPESTPSSAPTPGQTPTATPAPVTVPDGHIDPNIKECNNLPNGSFLRNSEHCRTYYVCRSGNAIKHRCAPNQWFDDIHFVCNVRQKVNCPSGKD